LNHFIATGSFVLVSLRSGNDVAKSYTIRLAAPPSHLSFNPHCLLRPYSNIIVRTRQV